MKLSQFAEKLNVPKDKIRNILGDHFPEQNFESDPDLDQSYLRSIFQSRKKLC